MEFKMMDIIHYINYVKNTHLLVLWHIFQVLDIKVNNDTRDRTNPGAVGINKMEINTKLLIADGDIVVIGGIKKNEISDAKEQVPGMGNIPIIGKMFQGREQVDKMNELLVFIAPRIL